MKFTVYGKPNCPYCDMAKKLIQSKSYDLVNLTVEEDFTVKELQDLVVEKTQVVPKTFPQIFLGDTEKYIGGYAELRAFINVKEQNNES